MGVDGEARRRQGGVSHEAAGIFGVLGGAAAAWPLAARAQPSGRVRRIGVILGDFDSAPRIKAFKSAWPALGWVEGRNIHIDYHLYRRRSRQFPISRCRARRCGARSHSGRRHIDPGRGAPKRRNRFQRYLLGSPIPRAQALSPASADREATSPVSRISSRRSGANGCKHSRRLRQM